MSSVNDMTAWEVVAHMAVSRGRTAMPWVPEQTALILAAMCQALLELRDHKADA
jgi:hypothetical protein